MCLFFIYHILIYSRTWEDHLRHLQIILKTLRQSQFFANMKKREFGQREVHYLGQVVSREGVKMDPQKVTAIEQWPTPKNIKALRGLLGLTGYIIGGLSKIMGK